MKGFILFTALTFGCKNAFSLDIKTVEHLSKLHENEVEVASVALDLAKEFYPKLYRNKYLEMISTMAKQVKSHVGESKSPRMRIKSINHVIYKLNRLSYDSNDKKVAKKSNRYLNGLLDTKKGSCITLSLLYVAIGQKLGYPIYPVIVPSHFFVRYIDSENSINIETTKGTIIKDERYIKDFNIPKFSIKTGPYMNKMSYKEYISELVAISAIAHFYKNNNYERGLKYMEIASKLRPITPEIYYTKGKMHFSLHKNYKHEGKLRQSRRHLTLSRKLYLRAKILGLIDSRPKMIKTASRRI